MRRRWARLGSLSAAQGRVAIASLLLLPVVERSLRRRGFVDTAAALAARSAGPGRVGSAAEAASVAEAVDLVAARRRLGVRCLGRSLVLWFLLRREGIDAELVLGAAPPAGTGPLPAHAWVEVAGAALNEAAGVPERFGRFDLGLPRLTTAPLAPGPVMT